MSKNVFFAGLILSASGYFSPPFALVAGLIYIFTFVHPYHIDARRLSSLLLQVSVVGLGFGMDLRQVLQVGRSGFVYTAVSITFAMLLGWGLGRILNVKRRISFLISAGTAICGGSAIAAVAPISGANEEEIAVSMGAVFALNSVALLAFPAIGTALHLTQTQFGLWAALAIHDTSSVVGAGAKFGAIALAIATTVKLARALWIVPMSVGTAFIYKRTARIQWPWFILFYLFGSCRQYVHSHPSTGISSVKAFGHYWPDGNAIPHRNRVVEEDANRRRGSAVSTGRPPLALRRSGIAFSHTRRLDSVVTPAN